MLEELKKPNKERIIIMKRMTQAMEKEDKGEHQVVVKTSSVYISLYRTSQLILGCFYAWYHSPANISLNI